MRGGLKSRIYCIYFEICQFLVSLRIPGIPGIPSILVPDTNFRDYGIGIKEQTRKEVDSNCTNAKGKRNNELEGRMDYLKVYIKQVLTHSDLLAILTALAEKINRLWTD